jgi:hypothetical protein
MATDNNTALAQRTIQYDLSGLEDPTVIPTRGAPGTTYRKLSIPSKFYIKLDEGTTTNWLDISSSGTVGGINLGVGAQILKNVITNTLYFRSLINSDNQLIITQLADEIRIDLNSNELSYPIQLVTNTNVYQTIWAYSMPISQAEKIGIKIIGRKADGSEHCLFERIGLFYNESGTTIAQRFWETITTLKSNANIDVRYVLSGSTIQIQVKSLNSDTFYWKGQVFQMPINTI